MSDKPTIKLVPTVQPADERAAMGGRLRETQIKTHSQLSESSQSVESSPPAPDYLLDQLSDFYKPRKKQISIRLDADVIAWFQQHFDKYQRAINQACRDYMKTHLEKSN